MKPEIRATIRATGLQTALLGTAFFAKTDTSSAWNLLFVLMIGIGVGIFIVYEHPCLLFFSSNLFKAPIMDRLIHKNHLLGNLISGQPFPAELSHSFSKVTDRLIGR